MFTNVYLWRILTSVLGVKFVASSEKAAHDRKSGAKKNNKKTRALPVFPCADP